MNRRLNTFRITEFKGINKSENPHNIDDAEFTDMVNLEIGENKTMQSRLGFAPVLIDVADISPLGVRSLCKVNWDDYTQTLYYARGYHLAKINETSGEETPFALFLGNSPIQFERWKDRVLLLAENYPIKWMGSTEAISDIKLPQFQLQYGSTVAASEGGELDDTVGYQYTVSFVLGNNYRDGETPGALPTDPWVWPGDPKDKTYPGPRYLPGNYAQAQTTNANRTITGSSVSYDAQLNGHEIGYLKLFRRKCRIGDSAGYLTTFYNMEEWVLLDTAFIKRTGDTYSLEKTVNTVVTSLTGTYSSTNDSVTITIGFTDTGRATYDAGSLPLNADLLQNTKARYMTRFNNRIFIANLDGADPRDKKTVRFSYLGTVNLNGTLVDEIDNFHYAFPMLVFGPRSWFYCDQSDTDDGITGIRGYQDNLLIFTEKCTFLWREGMLEPVKISSDIGCLSHYTICEFEGTLIWLSTNGIVRWDGKTLKNISADKVYEYTNSISPSKASKASAIIYNRCYYITAPFGGGTHNDAVLVYNFDLKEWSYRRYKIKDSSTDFYIDYLYTYTNASVETLYAGGHDSAGLVYVVKLDNGFSDYGADIACSFRTKYYDFGAPDIVKRIRNIAIDIGNFPGSLTASIYIDTLNTTADSFTHTGASTGFKLNSEAYGRLNVDSIVNITDEMFAFSLNRGLQGSRVQLGMAFNARAAQAFVHALTFDWETIRKLKRKYGS